MITGECENRCSRDDRLRVIDERLERIEVALFGKMGTNGIMGRMARLEAGSGVGLALINRAINILISAALALIGYWMIDL